MSATSKKPKLLCIGEQTILNSSITEGFASIGCSVDWLSYKQIEKDQLVPSSPWQYMCIFAPTISAFKSKKQSLSLESLQESLQKINQLVTGKKLLILPHPESYLGFNTNQKGQVLREEYSTFLNQIVVWLQVGRLSINALIYDHYLSSQNEEDPSFLESMFSSLPRQILLTREENFPITPLSTDQLIQAIKKILFTKQSNGQTFSVVGSKEISAINFILKIKRSLQNQTNYDPTITSIHHQAPQNKIQSKKISATGHQDIDERISQKVAYKLSQNKKIIPKPSIVLESVFSQKKPTQSQVKPPEKIDKKVKKVKKKTKPPSRKLKLTFKKIAILSTLVVMGMYVILMFAYLSNLNKTIKFAREGSIVRAHKSSKRVEFLHPITKPSLFFASIWLEKSISTSTFQISAELQESVGDLVSLVEKSKSIDLVGGEFLAGILGNQTGDVFKNIDQIQLDLVSLFEIVSSLEIHINKIYQSSNNSQLKDELSRLGQKISSSNKVIQDMQKVLSVGEGILGRDGKKTYAVLLQNNMELRPTGGFIGSFALLSFENGQMFDIETFDVYSADGQLRGHVEPPEPIKKYLGEANWYLRDSNFNPDFPSTARRVEWFLDKEINRQIDGVVGINLYVVQDLLEAAGGVDLADYDETITASNLFQRAQYKSELNYFDGSTQKKDFIASLINSLYLKVLDGEGEYRKKIITSFMRSAMESHLQISFRDKNVESSVSDTMLSGKIKPAICIKSSADSCISDYVAVFESNFGVNKVNYFITRNTSHKVNILEDKTTHQIDLIINNTAKNAAWPAGSYKNYLQFFIPENAVLKKAQIDDLSVPVKNITINQMHSKKIIGFLAVVPISESKTISIAYDLPHVVKSFDQYQLFLQKQSGVENNPIQVEITRPGSIPSGVNMGEIQSDLININTNNNTDQRIIVEY